MKYLLFILSLCCFSCVGKYGGVPEKYHELLDQAMVTAGDNAVEMEKALNSVPKEQKEGMAFLIAYMPERDLKVLTADFLLENVTYAYKAREQYEWSKQLPDSIFLNDVLPYVSLNEKREAWRKNFYDRFSKYVTNCKTIFEAIDSINKNIRKEVLVDYNTHREKPDQAPFESMKQHMASCSGLSILLTDALRAVGIPSRVAGTPNWFDKRGNHNWSEVWADGKWYFTEYYYTGHLNQSWFLADAGRAIKENWEHAIYASSFKPTGVSFPLVWDFDIKYVHAENVTDRYTDLYRTKLASKRKGENQLALRVQAYKDNAHNTSSEDRVAINLDLFLGKKQIGGGRTSGPTKDMNDVLTFIIEKGKSYTVKYSNAAGELQQIEVKTDKDPYDLKIYMK